MIFRQLFDRDSCTYTYLLASEASREALLIDPVLSRVDRYLQLLTELGLRLSKVIDTHVHADHISAMGALRDRTQCVTVMGKESAVDVVSMRVSDGESVGVQGITLRAMYTPGHTNDSYSFVMPDRVFTGDALFIRGTGRTDFQGGSSRDAYHSLFGKLLELPDATLVYPGHDYKGDTVSTIGEERAYNPRLQVKSADEYQAMMAALDLPNPRMMDVAVPANMKMGLAQSLLEERGLAVSADEAVLWHRDKSARFVDLRDASERELHGTIPHSLHAPYGALDSHLQAGGTLQGLGQSGEPIVVYCAFGERSAMCVERMQELGMGKVRNLTGGVDAWKHAGGQLVTD